MSPATAANHYDAVILGSGQGGNPLSKALAQAGWRTAMIERKFVVALASTPAARPQKPWWAALASLTWPVAPNISASTPRSLASTCHALSSVRMRSCCRPATVTKRPCSAQTISISSAARPDLPHPNPSMSRKRRRRTQPHRRQNFHRHRPAHHPAFHHWFGPAAIASEYSGQRFHHGAGSPP